MIGHYLSNNNENATVLILQKILHLNKPLHTAAKRDGDRSAGIKAATTKSGRSGDALSSAGHAIPMKFWQAYKGADTLGVFLPQRAPVADVRSLSIGRGVVPCLHMPSSSRSLPCRVLSMHFACVRAAGRVAETSRCQPCSEIQT